MLGVSSGAASPAAPTDIKTATAIILTPEPECPDWQFAVDATTKNLGRDAQSSSGHVHMHETRLAHFGVELNDIKVCNFSIVHACDCVQT